MWINELTRDIQYGQYTVTITVRGESGMDKFVERILLRRLFHLVTKREYTAIDYWSVEIQAINTLVEMINRTCHIEGLPETFANSKSSDKELLTTYEFLSKLPGKIMDEWLALIEKANEPPGDPDTVSPEKLPVEKRNGADPLVEKKETISEKS